MEKLIFCDEHYTVPSSQLPFITSNGLSDCRVIYQHGIIKGKSPMYNKQMFEQEIVQWIPDENYSGFAMLDWEGFYYYALNEWTMPSSLPAPTVAQMSKMAQAYLSALKFAKIIRPNAKWTYWGMPFQLNTSPYVDGLMSRYEDIMPILSEMDYLAPAFYVFHTDSYSFEEDFEMVYHNNENIKVCLELATLLNKPVYPTVWQRYHPSTVTAYAPYSNQLIRKDDVVPVTGDWYQYIKKFTDATLNGKTFDGIIWWNSMNFLFDYRADSEVLTAEFANVVPNGTTPAAGQETFSTYQARVLQSYYDNIKTLFPE